MGRKIKILLLVAVSLVALTVGMLYLDIGTIAVLVPMGEIAAKERDLLVISTWLMSIIIIPVFIATIWIAWRYRAGNTKAKYDPNWENSNVAEFIWWLVPCIIVAILSVLTWKGCHELTPFKPIESSVAPLRIQVVALQWKWLFIYPDYKIASINFLQFPKETPLNFEITADAPMNSFWIPQLGGQVYAMPAMRSKLHLIAHEEGLFTGSSANLSGKGFAGMTFQAKSCTKAEFDAWIQEMKQSPNLLNQNTYDVLTAPSANQPITPYLLQVEDLFERIIMRYMTMEEK
ncbi:MAG: ubiquinol oxidase subunit II [Rhabdochlamydiaceae bacterium]